MSAAPADAAASGPPRKTCATAGCTCTVQVWSKPKLCVVCEHRKRFDAERARLHAVLQSRRAETLDVRSPRCAFCTRPVVLVCPAVASEYVVCMECMGNSETAHITEPDVGPSAPHNPSLSAPHSAVQRTAPPTIAHKPVETIVIIRDPVSPTPPEALAPATLTARAAPNNLRLHVPTCQAIALRPPPSVQMACGDPAPDPSSTRPSAGPPVPHDSLLRRQLGVLFNRRDKTERAMAALAGKPHFNGKGEHIFPSLSVRRPRADRNISAREKRAMQPVGAPVSPLSTQAVREPPATRPALVSPTRASSSAWTPPQPATLVAPPVGGLADRPAVAAHPHTHAPATPARIDSALLTPPPLSSSTSSPPASAAPTHPTASLPSPAYSSSTGRPPVITLLQHDAPPTRPLPAPRLPPAPHAGCATPRRAHPGAQAPSAPLGSTRVPAPTDVGGVGPLGEHRHAARACCEQALPAPGGETQPPSQQQPPRGTRAPASPSPSSAPLTSLPPPSHVPGVQHRRPLARRHLTLAGAGAVRPSLQPALHTQVRSSTGPAPVAGARAAAHAWPDEPQRRPSAPPPRASAASVVAAAHRPPSPLRDATAGRSGPSSSLADKDGSRSFSGPPRTPPSSRLARIGQASLLSTPVLPRASVDGRTVARCELGATPTEASSLALSTAFHAHSREPSNPETLPPCLSPPVTNSVPIGPPPSSHPTSTTPPFTLPQPSDARSTVSLSDPPSSSPAPSATSAPHPTTPPSPVSPAFSQTSTLVGPGSTSTLSPSTPAVDDPWPSDLSDLTPLAASDSESESEPEVSLKAQLAQRRRLAAKPPHTCATPACHNLLVRGEARRLCAPCHDRTRTRAGRGLGIPAASAAGRTCTKCAEKVERGLPWRMCEGCRTSARMEWRTRRRRRVADVEDEQRAARKRPRLDRAHAGHERVDAPAAACTEGAPAAVCGEAGRTREGAAAERVCTGCYKMFGAVGPWKTCARCRTRTRTWWREWRMASAKDKRSSREPPPRMARDEGGADAGAKTLAECLSTVAPGPPMVYPTSGLLLAHLSTSISDFASRSPPTASPQLQLEPPTLAFAGEYSLVADPSGCDPLVRLHEMQCEVSSALGVAFSLAELQCLSEGVSGRWSCAHEIPMSSTTTVDEGAMAGTPPVAALPASPLYSAREAQAILGDDAATASGATVQRLLGQLDVSVIWDRSHPIFIGVKTLVMVKLVG